MLFNSFPFWGFFAAVLLLAYGVPAAWSRLVLVLASFIFYGVWSPRLVLLLAGCVVFNYATGILIGAKPGRRARVWLAVAVTANLGLLALFKYYGLLSQSVAGLVGVPADAFALHIVLPVAISFYSFEAISYNVDIYRGHLAARKNLIDFALFISFFPHLAAGPIIRPGHFFPQLSRRHLPDGEEIGWGSVQIVKGLIKKIVFADHFALIANAYFSFQVGHAGLIGAWIGTLAFSMQIYFDFSGYTDIARGCAMLLGLRFPANFERPYLSADITEFWRRWHISLSTWLRDYLYIPLGGNRLGGARTYANLIVTMGLGGLWHGAAWNFVLWGLYHGALLALHRAWRGRSGPAFRGPAGHPAGICLTFLLVTLGWVMFRTPDFATSWLVFGELFAGDTRVHPNMPSDMFVLLAACALWLVLDRDRRLQSWFYRGGGVSATLKISSALALSLMALEMFSNTSIAVPFIYFQF